MTTESDIKTARMIGALFLVSMTVSLIYSGRFEPIFDSKLELLYAQRRGVMFGAFLESINCAAVVGIAVMFYSILRRTNETLARCYVALRTVECGILIVGVIAGLRLVPLSREFIGAGMPVVSSFEANADFFLFGKHLALQGAIFICGLGGLLMTSSLYLSRFIPRIISGWGFFGYVLVILSAVLDISGAIDSTQGPGMLFYLPGGLFETLILPFWLILRGFDSPASAPRAQTSSQA
jgi:hypothetical protein